MGLETGNWDEIQLSLQETLNKIFCEYNIDELNGYQKRKIVFEYLVKNLKYDYDLLAKIRDNAMGIARNSRQPYLELLSVMKDGIGVCNAISQYYKLLLEQLGIKVYCVICNDGTEVGHQLNLVYDEYFKAYSFDDITSVIVDRGSIEEFFDYDLKFANYKNQGNVDVYIGENKKWIFLLDEWLNYFIGRSQSPFSTLEDLPDDIVSVKTMHKYVK